MESYDSSGIEKLLLHFDILWFLFWQKYSTEIAIRSDKLFFISTFISHIDKCVPSLRLPARHHPLLP